MDLMALSLNSCQKICLAVTSSSCLTNNTYTWSTTTPSLVTLTAGSVGCIVKVNSLTTSGVAFVFAQDATSTVVFGAQITITPYFNVVFPASNASILCATLVQSPPVPSILGTPLIIGGPFNSFASSNLNNLVFFTFNQLRDNGASVFANALVNNNFVPGTNSVLNTYPLNGTVPVTNITFKIGMLMFRTLTSSFADPYFPSVFAITLPKPGTGQGAISVQLPKRLPCTFDNYISFTQLITTQTTGLFTFGSVVNSDSASVSIQYGNLLNNLVANSFGISILVCPKGFFTPISSNTFIYSNTVVFNVPAAPFTGTVTVNLPVGGMPAATMWFAQPQDISLSITTPTFGPIQVYAVQQTATSSTSTTLDFKVGNNNSSIYAVTMGLIGIFPRDGTSTFTFQ